MTSWCKVLWHIPTVAATVIAAAACREAARAPEQPISPAEYALAYSAAIRDQAETVGERVALDPRIAWPESSIVRPADAPDTLRLGSDLIHALLARPEVAGVCVPEQLGAYLPAFCDVSGGTAGTVRYAVRFSTPYPVARDTVEFLVSFERVRRRLDTSWRALAIAYGVRYRVAQRDTVWVVVAKRRTFIT